MDKNTTKIVTELRKFKRENKLNRVILFGSRATNKYTQYSDIDLVVVSSRFEKLKSFKRAPTLRLKLNTDLSVDMLCYTPEEFEKKKREPTIVNEAVKEGISI